MKEFIKLYETASEYGALHNEDCCVNFPEDNRACDVSDGILECCENMKMVKAILDEAVKNVVEFISHDMKLDNEEQRKTVVKGYLTGELEEEIDSLPTEITEIPQLEGTLQALDNLTIRK